MKMSDREIRRLIRHEYTQSERGGACESSNRPQKRTSYDGDINAKLDEILRRLDAVERSVNSTSSQISEQNMHWDMYTM